MSSAHYADRDRMGHPFIHRRAFVLGAVSTALVQHPLIAEASDIETKLFGPVLDRRYLQIYTRMYAAVPRERFPIPAVDVRRINPKFLRQRVIYETAERPGTIVVDPNANFLYLVQSGGMALRYGVGVGKEGFGWSGRATIDRKAQWPTWTPPLSMIVREPHLKKYAGGMPPGLNNPLGARALYLYQNGRDTLYRLHGTNEPWSIGRSVSSGCIRLFNQDIIDLYDRTPVGTLVTVFAYGRLSTFAR